MKENHRKRSKWKFQKLNIQYLNFWRNDGWSQHWNINDRKISETKDRNVQI